MVVGPNTPISNGSLMPSIEAQVEFALSFVDKIQRQAVKSVVVNREANTEFNDYKDAVMETLTFSGNCNSWCVPLLPYSLNPHPLLTPWQVQGRHVEWQDSRAVAGVGEPFLGVGQEPAPAGL